MIRLLPNLLLVSIAVAPLSALAQDKKAEMKSEPAKAMEAQKDEPTKATEKKPAANKTESAKDQKPKRGGC